MQPQARNYCQNKSSASDLGVDLSLLESDPHCGAEAPAGLNSDGQAIWRYLLVKIRTFFDENPDFEF